MTEECGKAIPDSIRENSKAGLLVPEKEIFAQFIRKSEVESDEQSRAAAAKAILDEMIRSNEDVQVISDSLDRRYYYSTPTMTEAYARLLVLKKESASQMMASIIREHSAKYPRPVPISIFANSPFKLSQDEIASCMNEMVEMQEYEDIEQVTTSIGNRFLYSNRYLDSDYAMMLAEWEDVGQSENP